jgi:hypothetical protein
MCVCVCVGGGDTDFLDVEKGNFMILLGLWDRKLSAIFLEIEETSCFCISHTTFTLLYSFSYITDELGKQKKTFIHQFLPICISDEFIYSLPEQDYTQLK